MCNDVIVYHEKFPETSAWRRLTATVYSQDVSVQDGTGVTHLPGTSGWSFAADRRTPTPKMGIEKFIESLRERAVTCELKVTPVPAVAGDEVPEVPVALTWQEAKQCFVTVQGAFGRAPDATPCTR